MLDRSSSGRRCAALLSLAVIAGSVPAQDEVAAQAGPRFSKVQQRAVDFLLGKQEDGVFIQEKKPHIGVTALALAAVLTKPASLRNEAETTFVTKASRFLIAGQNKNGSFGDHIHNYQTSAVARALAGLDDADARKALVKARDFLLRAQNVEGGGFQPTDQSYGSFGYGPGDRGDMSNTQLALEALRDAGLEKDHEAFAKAIAFLQRCQNLKKVNDYKTEVTEKGSDVKHPVRPGDDGGAVYFPGNSKFGFDVLADGVRSPRSYGSMTYALLKTYAICGVPADDPRVQAAVRWIRRNWTLDVNPGAHAGLQENAPYQGLFYYYLTMARALQICGIDSLETTGVEGDTRKVDWRAELARRLAATQREDGSWINDKNGRWWENQPVMCTIYALLALKDCGA